MKMLQELIHNDVIAQDEVLLAGSGLSFEQDSLVENETLEQNAGSVLVGGFPF